MNKCYGRPLPAPWVLTSFLQRTVTSLVKGLSLPQQKTPWPVPPAVCDWGNFNHFPFLFPPGERADHGERPAVRGDAKEHEIYLTRTKAAFCPSTSTFPGGLLGVGCSVLEKTNICFKHWSTMLLPGFCLSPQPPLFHLQRMSMFLAYKVNLFYIPKIGSLPCITFFFFLLAEAITVLEMILKGVQYVLQESPALTNF